MNKKRTTIYYYIFLIIIIFSIIFLSNFVYWNGDKITGNAICIQNINCKGTCVNGKCISNSISNLIHKPITTISTSCTIACCNEKCLTQNINFLIVTRPMFIDSLKDFISWKKTNGFKVGIITADWVNTNYYDLRGIDYSIKNSVQKFIKQNGAKYVLLVGHTQIGNVSPAPDFVQDFSIPGAEKTANSLSPAWNLPIGYAYTIGTDQGPNTKMVIYSDLFYVDRKSWDNRSGTNERPYCNLSLFDFGAAVGRWPVKTAEEIKTISAKTINFRASPFAKALIINSEDLSGYSTDKCFQRPQVYSDPNINNQHYNNLEQQHIFGPKCGLIKVLQEKNKPYTIIESKINNRIPVSETILNTDLPIFYTAHGSREGIFFPDGEMSVSQDWIHFTPNFRFVGKSPLLTSLGNSCSVVHWYSKLEVPAFLEGVLKLDNGPPVLMGAVPNEYDFSKSLLEGKTVGESFTTNRNESYQCLYYTQLLGDPSLKLFSSV